MILTFSERGKRKKQSDTIRGWVLKVRKKKGKPVVRKKGKKQGGEKDTKKEGMKGKKKETRKKKEQVYPRE